MSNRLTFSLASLILIFAMSFVPTAVMAATGGPTVTLAPYSGVEAPETDPATQTGANNQHTQARDDFRVKLTFSHPVGDPATTDIDIRWKTDGEFGGIVDATAVVEVYQSNGREFVATLPAAPGVTTTQVSVGIAEDAVLGSGNANLLGNVGKSMIFTLPPLNTGTVNLAAPTAVTGTPGAYTIVATFDSGQTDTAHTLSTAFTDATYVSVEPENAATVTVGAEDSSVTGKLSYPLTVQLTYGATGVRVSIDPGYVKGSNTITLPPPEAPPAVTENPPAAAIAVRDLDETARTFRVEVTFTPAAKSDGSAGSAITGFDQTGLEIKDAGDGDVTVTVEASRSGDNSYTAILKYDLLSTLPLTIKVKQSVRATSNADYSAMVRAPDTTAPTVTHDAPATAITAATTVTLTFSESVSGVTVTGNPTGDMAKYMVAVTGTGMTRTVTITPTAAASLTADVAQTPVTFTVAGQDAAGNAIAAGTTFTVTLAARMAPVRSTPPAAAIAVSNLNVATRTFEVTVTLTPAAKSDGSDGDDVTGFDSTYLDIVDASGDVGVTASAERKAANSYRAILKYDALATLPLTVTVDQMMLETSNADHSAMVGTAPDNTAPTVTHDAPATAITAATTVTLTFSESVSGVTVTGNPTGDMAKYMVAVTGTGMTRTVTITPTAAASLTADVAQTPVTFTVAGQDAAGNAIAAGTTFTVTLAARMAPDTGNGGGMPVDQTDPIIIQAPTSSSAPINVGARFSNPMIPAYGFAVLVRDMEASGIYSPVQGTWLLSSNTSLPDLAWFFGGDGGPNTGTIILNGTGVENKDLIISEIMWGRDSSLADSSKSQWIEFYNTTPNPIDLSNFTITFHRSQAFPSHAGAIDVVSNVGHVYFGNSQFPGSSGRSNTVDSFNRFAQPVNIVSMHRVLNHVRIKQQNVGNRGERNKGIGGWAASAYEAANIAPFHVATPGHEQITRARLANSSPRQHVIINEIGNSSNDAHDWIELYNTGAAISIENWEFMRVTARSGGGGEEKFIARFPKLTIPANSYVVITKTNPRDQGNDLAAGIDLARGDADQLNRGLGSKPDSTVAYYLVDSELTLPNDNDRCLYILRHAHDREGQPTHIEDVVGTLGLTLRGPSTASWTWYSANDRRVWDTAMWPLQGRGGPHGDVVHDAGPEHFGAGRVYQRSGKNSGTGEHHLSVRGYTGIGYDRIAKNNPENGGTPGYANGALKGDKSDWADQVSFSEIMLVTHTDAADGRIPRATRLPQWLEIYNSSLTEGVSINNWYLEIQNADTEDLDTRDLHGTLRLPNMTIPPNQTILITTSAGLNSGHFPELRLINLFLNGTYRNILTIQARGDSVLSQVGFYIELRDHKGNHVDEIGNLNVRSTNRRRGTEPRDVSNFNTLWDIPSMITDDGHRSSLIRIYDNGVPRDGLNPVGGPKNSDTSWILASNTNFRRVPNLTYYGNHQDYGTPGYRGGGPLPVSLSKFRPERLDDGTVVIRWITESELNNAGFNILRSDTRSGEFTKVNTQLIKGHGTTSERNTYEFTDTSAKPNVVYYYQIQDVSIDGDIQTLRVSRLKGNVSAAGKITTTWGELKALQ